MPRPGQARNRKLEAVKAAKEEKDRLKREQSSVSNMSTKSNASRTSEAGSSSGNPATKVLYDFTNEASNGSGRQYPLHGRQAIPQGADDAEDDDEEMFTAQAAITASAPPLNSATRYDGMDYDEVEYEPLTQKIRGAQALPVATIPEDWEGVPEDGAMYLALAMRDNAKLPAVTRVVNPYREPTPPPRSAQIGPQQVSPEETPQAGPSRHPALPRDSWVVLFALHFVAYRKLVSANWPPNPRLPYPSTYPPIPGPTRNDYWLHYINGYPRRKIKRRVLITLEGIASTNPLGQEDQTRMLVDEAIVDATVQPSPEKGESAHVPIGGDDLDDDAMDTGDDDEEEAFMNVAQPPPKQYKEIEELEEESERHHPREPLVSILQTLDTPQISNILYQISKYLSETIDHLVQLETMNDTLETIRSNVDHLIPTQPISPRLDPVSPSASTASLKPKKQPPHPFPVNVSKWLFALLTIYDDHLSSDQMHHLRELARNVMKVGGWVYISAVKRGDIGPEWKLDMDKDVAGSGGRSGTAAGSAATNVKWTDRTGVNEILSRCWMIVSAIAEGWAQRDLLMELVSLFQ